MLKSPSFKNYRIQEFIQFTSNVLMIVKQHGADKLKIKALYTMLFQSFEQLQSTYKQDGDNETTRQLMHLDNRRDQAVICLRKICDGYAHHHDKALNAAGRQVVACIDKYGSKLYHLNYSAETAVLKNLVQDLQTDPACNSAIQEMHLEAVVKEIKQVNEKFEKLFIERLENFSKDETKSTKELIRSVTEAYRTLVQHVEAHATLAPSAAYTSFINHLNENIEHFNQVVERRKKSGVPEATEPLGDEAVDV